MIKCWCKFAAVLTLATAATVAAIKAPLGDDIALPLIVGVVLLCIVGDYFNNHVAQLFSVRRAVSRELQEVLRPELERTSGVKEMDVERRQLKLKVGLIRLTSEFKPTDKQKPV